MTEAEEYLEKRRSSQLRQTLLSSITVLGLVALAVAVVVLYFRWDSGQRETTVIVDRVQTSLKVACDAAAPQELPKNVQEDCAAADQNKLPEKLQQDIDDPEIQDPEIQDPEIQESESQDPEAPDSETNDPDPTDDPDPDDPEIQDPEIDDPPVPGPQGIPGEPGPTCPSGYTAADRFVEGNPMTTDDDQTWLVCVKD